MSNPIDQVRDRLDEGRLWQKGDLGEYDLLDEPVCLLGACQSVSHAGLRLGAVRQPLVDVIVEQYADRLMPWQLSEGDVATFNDHPDTTWADVATVLDKASVLWDEAHS